MKKSDIAVRGARIVTPHDTIEGDLYVSGGKIIGLGRFDLPSQKVVDASGLIILPGMVDAHVHFMDPGEMSREDFPTGSAAAAVAGVTTVIEHNHAGPVYRSEDLSDKVAYLKSRSVVDFVLVDSDTEYTLEDKNIISKAGWTPYAGRKLRGKVVGTYLRGHKIAKDGVCVAPTGWGRFVPGRGYTG